MIFVERPITVRHIRDVCARFNEGLRVEYKSTFDASVRDQLPKIVSSFANSQGGVLVVGISAVNGVPQAPFDGFVVQPREEYPLTVENICLRNIYPSVLPRTQVVPSDTANQIFLVIEVEESGEAPHAIENSRKVYVRTGNAANPYDLAEVDLIIDLLKRREEPEARRVRLLKFAEQRSLQTVPQDRPFMQISICPRFPRTPVCTSQQSLEFLSATALANAQMLPFDSLKRVPGGAASLRRQHPTLQQVRPQYMELGNYGLLFLARPFSVARWAGADNPSEQLAFGDLFHWLIKLTVWAGSFYGAHGYSGSLGMSISLHHVQGWAMRFFDPVGLVPDDPEDFTCYTDVVSADRLVTVEQIRAQRVDVLTGILAELTWAFWQSNNDHPTGLLRRHVEGLIHQLRA
jgi:hypothetical protein